MRASLFEVRSSVVWAEWWRRSGLFLRSRICFWALSMATSQPRTNALAHTLHSHTTNLDRGIRFGYLPDIRAHVFGKWLRHGKKKKKRERERWTGTAWWIIKERERWREWQMERVTDEKRKMARQREGEIDREAFFCCLVFINLVDFADVVLAGHPLPKHQPAVTSPLPWPAAAAANPMTGAMGHDLG